MEEQFLPYNLALKLKELGFKDGSLGFSYMRFKCEGTSNAYIGRVVPDYLYHGWDLLCIAPLWQQAFDWFRDKGYGAFVETWINGGVKKFRGRNNYAPLFITDVFDTYEEAREACLEKLIELCEKK